MAGNIPGFPGALRRAPFALLAWVVSALLPADLLGVPCRARVLRALVNVAIAVRRAKPSEEHRDILEGLADRAQAAIEALASDPFALIDEALPPSKANIDGRTVAKVLYAFAQEVHARHPRLAGLFAQTIDAPVCERLAVRASTIELREEEPAQEEPARAEPPKPKKKPR